MISLIVLSLYIDVSVLSAYWSCVGCNRTGWQTCLFTIAEHICSNRVGGPTGCRAGSGTSAPFCNISSVDHNITQWKKCHTLKQDWKKKKKNLVKNPQAPFSVLSLGSWFANKLKIIREGWALRLSRRKWISEPVSLSKYLHKFQAMQLFALGSNVLLGLVGAGARLQAPTWRTHTRGHAQD